MADMNTNLYQQVVDVTTGYLGPAAERFISRQIKTHLHKSPAELTQEDIIKLTDWIKVAIALLTEDSQMVEDFTKSLLELAKIQPQQPGSLPHTTPNPSTSTDSSLDAK